MKPTESRLPVWNPSTLWTQAYINGVLDSSRHNLQPHIDNLAVAYTKVMQINHLADVLQTAEAYSAAHQSRAILIKKLFPYTTKDDPQQWASTMADGIIEDICKRISNDMENLGNDVP
jgi:hypothetical protein